MPALSFLHIECLWAQATVSGNIWIIFHFTQPRVCVCGLCMKPHRWAECSPTPVTPDAIPWQSICTQYHYKIHFYYTFDVNRKFWPWNNNNRFCFANQGNRTWSIKSVSKFIISHCNRVYRLWCLMNLCVVVCVALVFSFSAIFLWIAFHHIMTGTMNFICIFSLK